jgi:hypothetical protein
LTYQANGCFLFNHGHKRGGKVVETIEHPEGVGTKDPDPISHGKRFHLLLELIPSPIRIGKTLVDHYGCLDICGDTVFKNTDGRLPRAAYYGEIYTLFNVSYIGVRVFPEDLFFPRIFLAFGFTG